MTRSCQQIYEKILVEERRVIGTVSPFRRLENRAASPLMSA